ncbi:MAG: hypothetical protein IKZ07_06315 [Akkermansia sp.]|nr:hypothetical protein [Akkermansia sp.]
MDRNKIKNAPFSPTNTVKENAGKNSTSVVENSNMIGLDTANYVACNNEVIINQKYNIDKTMIINKKEVALRANVIDAQRIVDAVEFIYCILQDCRTVQGFHDLVHNANKFENFTKCVHVAKAFHKFAVDSGEYGENLDTLGLIVITAEWLIGLVQSTLKMEKRMNENA